MSRPSRRPGGLAAAVAVAALVVVVLGAAVILSSRAGDLPAAVGTAPATSAPATSAPTGLVPTATAPPSRQPAAPAAAPTEAASSTPTPTPETSATSAAPPEPPPGTTPPVFAEIAAEVSDLRGLPVDEPVQARVVDDDTLADIVSDLAFEEMDESTLDADERLLRTLRLIPGDLDLRTFSERLYREQVLGLYTPSDEVFYVSTAGEELSPSEAFTTAHEITHALQDQAFDLEALRDLPDRESDGGLALLALVEGDAVLAQQVWSARNQNDAERMEIVTESQAAASGVLEEAPPYLRDSLVFPYREGARFVAQLYRRGGFAAVDDAYADPPTTTEQILHPDRYLAGEDAVELRLPAQADGWQRATAYTFGEFDLRQLLQGLGSETATTVGEGWGGGLVGLYERGGQDAVVGVLTFDTEADASEACEALPRWYAAVADSSGGDGGAGTPSTQDADAFARTCDETRVRFAAAPDAGSASDLAGD